MPGTIAERTASGHKARKGEIVPLTAEQSNRLASLYEEYERRLVRYAYSQLRKRGEANAAAWTLAEDVAQTAWVEVGRWGGRGPLLSGEELSEDSTRALLYCVVKQQVVSYKCGKAAGELPVDFGDPATCNRLCESRANGCALAELPENLAAMVAALPEQERTALLFRLDGVDPRSLAEHLDCSASTAERLASAAVLRLQIDNPELSAEPVAPESLPEWEQKALSELSPERRAALLRLDSVTRQALLLKHQGVSKREISQRLGLTYDAVSAVAKCAPAAKCTPKTRSTGRRSDSRYAQVAQELRQDIEKMRAGDRLPRKVDLMQRFGVSQRVIDNAWAVLRSEGLIQSNGVYGYTVTRAQDDMERVA